MTDKQIDALLLEIVHRNLPGVETLEERRMDSLDFHDCNVLGIRDALRAAFEAGRSKGRIEGALGRIAV